MTEPPEPQETPEPDVPVETPETPKEPTEGPETPDTPDEEEEPSEAPEETLSAQQPQGKSETEIEKGLRALEREAQRHAKRVGEIMEEDTQHLLRCELCAPLIPGFRWPQVPEDQRAAVMLAIGFEPQRQLRPDKRAHACPDCDGEGSVATGSKVKGQDALPCIDCVGSGWVGPRRDAPVQAVTPPPPAVAVNGPSGAAAADPERAEFERRAKELGFMVIDTRVPAAT